MASRQGGPGRGEAPGTGTTERPYAADLETPAPLRGRGSTSVHNAFEPVSPTARPRTLGVAPRIPGVVPRIPGGPCDSRDNQRPAVARTPEDPPLRDPGLYALTDHFLERLGQSGRYVSTRTVSDAIRRGQLRWNRTDGWRFAIVVDGVRFIVVVGDTETDSPVVVTAWTEIADRSVALASTRWDDSDVDTIDVRAALSESAPEPIPDRLRPRTVRRPFEIGGHRLKTGPGEPYVRCVACRCRFRSKSELTDRRCHPRAGGD